MARSEHLNWAVVANFSQGKVDAVRLPSELPQGWEVVDKGMAKQAAKECMRALCPPMSPLRVDDAQPAT